MFCAGSNAREFKFVLKVLVIVECADKADIVKKAMSL